MPSFDWISLFLVVTIFMGSLVCMLIILHFNKFKLANALLLTYIGGISIFITMNFLNHSGLMLQIPWLYRIPSFIYYLIPPAAFLYVTTIARDEEHLRKWDYLHFIPAMLHFLEMIPYHLQPLHVKQNIVAQAMANNSLIYAFNEGLLPAYWHHFLRSMLGLIYSIAMLKVVYRIKQLSKSNAGISISTIRWLHVFAVLTFCISIILALGFFLNLFFDLSIFQFYTLGVSIIFMISFYYMYFHPEILYGVPRIVGGALTKSITNKPDLNSSLGVAQVPESNFQIAETSRQTMSMDFKSGPALAQSDFEYLRQYQPRLEGYLEQSKPFLKGGYSIRDMSVDTGIPQHHLSALLNKIYGVRFNDFVNQYRISYLSERIATGDYQNLSMDGIAEQAGFGSRGTLFNSIKKLKGVTPTDFFNLRKS